MKKFFALLVFLITTQALAQLSILKSDEDFNYDNFYRIRMHNLTESASVGNQTINLLDFEAVSEKLPQPAVPYNRDTHFGGWLVESNAGCLNTRAKVLVRDSLSNVTYSSTGCTVATGQWDDPYTARMHTQARDIQIDHLVALKNAYMTGAHEWSFEKRCLYANYMGNKFHLLSVNGPENMKKSDHTPEGYTPPNRRYTCQFVKNWLNIKAIWNLRITPREGQAIQKIVRDSKCDSNLFKVPYEHFEEQDRFISDNANLCSRTSASFSSF
jgi:hypothetical protein